MNSDNVSGVLGAVIGKCRPCVWCAGFASRHTSAVYSASNASWASWLVLQCSFHHKARSHSPDVQTTLHSLASPLPRARACALALPLCPLTYPAAHPCLCSLNLNYLVHSQALAQVWDTCIFSFYISRLTSHISHIMYLVSLVWKTHDVGLKSLLYLLYTVSRWDMILTQSQVLILASRFFNQPG